jgi:hypothetical protein
LICGDRSSASTTDCSVPRRRSVFTDPPYNVPIDGHVCGSGRIRHREFAMAAGE